MTSIKKIKAPIGDENMSINVLQRFNSSIKKIKAPIGDENRGWGVDATGMGELRK